MPSAHSHLLPPLSTLIGLSLPRSVRDGPQLRRQYLTFEWRSADESVLRSAHYGRPLADGDCVRRHDAPRPALSHFIIALTVALGVDGVLFSQWTAQCARAMGVPKDEAVAAEGADSHGVV